MVIFSSEWTLKQKNSYLSSYCTCKESYSGTFYVCLTFDLLALRNSRLGHGLLKWRSTSVFQLGQEGHLLTFWKRRMFAKRSRTALLHAIVSYWNKAADGRRYWDWFMLMTFTNVIIVINSSIILSSGYFIFQGMWQRVVWEYVERSNV